MGASLIASVSPAHAGVEARLTRKDPPHDSQPRARGGRGTVIVRKGA